MKTTRKTKFLFLIKKKKKSWNFNRCERFETCYERFYFRTFVCDRKKGAAATNRINEQLPSTSWDDCASESEGLMGVY